ncbi:hypothetical protein EBR96_10865, partial [bacterium]|nr:hypothetical protein [bacterium]
VQFRIHGGLSEPIALPPTEFGQLVSQIKIIAGIDIGQTGTPHDGRIRLSGRFGEISLRISTLPTIFGEDIVIHLLRFQARTLDELGLSDGVRPMIADWLQLTAGLILVTGATGSGKSTTLYSLLSELKKRGNQVIVALEDPVEQVIPGIRQSPINRSAGYTFSGGLRATLRQDPDIIMVGEIRDAETASTALEAAYTGHLVLSTLHTTNVADTIRRLSQFDLDPFWIGMALKGILAQRLIPIECECKGSAECAACGGSGRTGRRLDVEAISLIRCHDVTPLIQGQIPEDSQWVPFFHSPIIGSKTPQTIF